MTIDTALAVALNRHSSRSLVELALQRPAATGHHNPVTHLVVTHQHALGSELISTMIGLTDRYASRSVLEDYLRLASDTYTPVSYALTAEPAILRRAIGDTGDPDPIYQAAQRRTDADARWLLLRNAPPDHWGQHVRDLLEDRTPLTAADTDALAELELRYTERDGYLNALVSPLLTARSLGPIIDHLLHQPQLNPSTTWSLVRAAVHPATPEDLRAHALAAIPAGPSSKGTFADEMFTELIAKQLTPGTGRGAPDGRPGPTTGRGAPRGSGRPARGTRARC